MSMLNKNKIVKYSRRRNHNKMDQINLNLYRLKFNSLKVLDFH